MKSRLPTLRLDDIAEFTNGGAWNQEEYSESGIPVTRVSDIHGGTVDLSSCKYLPESSLGKYAKNQLQEGDLIICTVGSHPTQPGSVVGRAGIVPRSANGSLLNQNAVCVRPKTNQIDKRWLGYIGKSESFHDYIKAHARGSASQVRMAIGLLKEMPVQVPDLDTQRKIAGILSAYDDLIDNNLRRIKILEEMAQSLYRDWFVQFRFPGHEAAKFVDSALGQIPKGWEVKTISDFGKVVTGKTPSKANEDFFGEDVSFLKTPDMHGQMFILRTNEYLSTSGAESQANKTLPVGSICVSCIGTIGVVSITTEPCQTNQQINSVVLADEASREFLFFWLREAKQMLENLGSNGATMGNVNKSKFEGMKLVCPPRDLLARFHSVTEPMFEQIERLFRKIQNLRQTRDLLLPHILNDASHMHQ